MITALALVGDTMRGTAIAADWTAHMPQQYKLRDSLDVLGASAELALARGDPREALRLLRLADVKAVARASIRGTRGSSTRCTCRTRSLPIMRSSRPRRLPRGAAVDAHELARAYRRLGEIYEERRDWKRAMQRYQDFVNLWEHADAALQPAVKDVAGPDRAHSGEGGVVSWTAGRVSRTTLGVRIGRQPDSLTANSQLR